MTDTDEGPRAAKRDGASPLKHEHIPLEQETKTMPKIEQGGSAPHSDGPTRSNLCSNQRMEAMSAKKRFVLNEKRYVVDTFNPANSGKGYCHEGDPEEDRHLRERVLMTRLSDILEKLIINPRADAEAAIG